MLLTQISSHFPWRVELLSAYFKCLTHSWISKLKLRKSHEVAVFFLCCAYFFLSQIQKNIISKRQTIVVPSGFSCIFKSKQKRIFEHFPVIIWKCWSRLSEQVSLKTLIMWMQRAVGVSLCYVSGSEIWTSLMGHESDTGLLMKLGQRNAACGVFVCRNEITCNIHKLLLTKFRRDKKAI